VKRRGRPALTPWFPGNVRPARPGVYQRRLQSCKESFYAMWDGRRWHLGADSLDDTIVGIGMHSIVQCEPRAQWRGRRHPAS